MAWKGKYNPSNPDKYQGDPTKIVYRSSWERDVFYHLDHNPNVLKWSSEEIIIPYLHPLDSRVHRYFPDIYAKMRAKDGSIIQTIIEVKPQKETVEPKKPKRPSKRYANQMAKYLVNEAKWNAAQEYCISNGYEFRVMTEYDIYGPSGKKYNHKKNKKKKA